VSDAAFQPEVPRLRNSTYLFYLRRTTSSGENIELGVGACAVEPFRWFLLSFLIFYAGVEHLGSSGSIFLRFLFKLIA
jgi:hypothetical protein